MKFEELAARLGGSKTSPDVSELHGRVAGWISAGALAVDSLKSEVYAEWLGADALTDEFVELITGLAKDVQRGLSDIDLGFQLLLPEDEIDINTQQKCISQWCGGFLSGFGMTGRFQQSELDQEVAEVMTDMARIAGLDEELPEDDENEGDLIEITEYVRMAALLVFTECGTRSVH